MVEDPASNAPDATLSCFDTHKIDMCCTWEGDTSRRPAVCRFPRRLLNTKELVFSSSFGFRDV
jgi:hypothetical protein